jgi:hypothetical protein
MPVVPEFFSFPFLYLFFLLFLNDAESFFQKTDVNAHGRCFRQNNYLSLLLCIERKEEEEEKRKKETEIQLFSVVVLNQRE